MTTVHNTNAGTEPSFLNAVAFRDLYNRYQPGLFFLVHKLVEHQPEAEDIVTDSFLKLWNSRHQFNSPEAAASWLRVTARNASLDLLKHKKIRDEKLQELTHLTQHIESQWFTEDILGDLLQEIYAAAETLPQRTRQVFQLRYLKGFKNEEIAEMLGVQYQSVRNHLATALKTLRLKFPDKNHLLSVFLILLGQRD